jgi:hypothetical protein
VGLYFHPRTNRDMDYLLVSVNSTSDAQILDELSVQHALKSSLLSVCGQTASTYIDILAFLDDEGVPQLTGKSAQVVLRVNSAYVLSHSGFANSSFTHVRSRWQAEGQYTRCHRPFPRPSQILDQTAIQIPSFTPPLFTAGALLRNRDIIVEPRKHGTGECSGRCRK